MEAAVVERAGQHAAHLEFVDEANTAIEAVDECLALLNSLGSGAASLIQVTKIQRSFKKVGESLKRTRYGSFIKALLKLSEFADPVMLGKVTAKFQEVRDSLVTDIENSVAEEAGQVAAHATFMGVSQDTVDQARARVAANTAALE